MQVTDVNLNLQGQTANNLPQQAGDAKTALAGKAAAATNINTNTSAAKTKESSKDDIVNLSTAAQVKLLYQEGNSASEIASQLKIDVKTVESYLDPGSTIENNAQQAYGPASQTTAASQSNDNTGKIHAPAQAGSLNDQVKTVAQNSGESGSYAKSINRLSGAGSTVTTETPKP